MGLNVSCGMRDHPSYRKKSLKITCLILEFLLMPVGVSTFSDRTVADLFYDEFPAPAGNS